MASATLLLLGVQALPRGISSAGGVGTGNGTNGTGESYGMGHGFGWKPGDGWSAVTRLIPMGSGRNPSGISPGSAGITGAPGSSRRDRHVPKRIGRLLLPGGQDAVLPTGPMRR